MSAPQNGAPSKIIHVACMAHARRHFFEAFEKSQSPIAKEALLRRKGFQVVGSMENPPTNPAAVAAARPAG